MLLRSAQPARGQFGTISGTLIYYMATYIDWVAQLAQLMTCSRVSSRAVNQPSRSFTVAREAYYG